MSSTKVTKSVLGHKASVQYTGNTYMSTQEISVSMSGKIKMIHKNDNVGITSGYRKVDFSEQKRKEIYKKINKMLGGN